MYDDDEDDDGTDEAGWNAEDLKTSDEKGRTRLCSEMCSTCIFRPARSGRLQGITNERVRNLVERARRRDAPIICHATIGTTTPAMCRGFADRYSTNLMRVMGRINGIVEVDPATVKRPEHG